jgi:hypothetical protein
VEIREAPGARLLVALEIITSDPSQLAATDWIAFTSIARRAITAALTVGIRRVARGCADSLTAQDT